VLSLVAAACGAAGSHESAATKVLVPTYLFGTLGTRTLDLQDVCGGQPLGQVDVYPTWSTVLVGVLTLGTYTPVEIRVRCNNPRPARVAAHRTPTP
jgi:hypothetical protein